MSSIGRDLRATLLARLFLGRAVGRKHRPHDSGDSPCQRWWHGISDLSRYFDLGSTKMKGIGKAHKACGFPMRDWAVLDRVEIAAFFRFEKLRPDRYRRPVPPKAAEKVGTAARLPYPTLRRKMKRAPL
jgi:hypothetical protein